MPAKLKTEPLRASVPIQVHSRIASACGKLTLVDGRSMSANDFARRAVLFLLRAVEACYRCTLGVDCPEHGKAIEAEGTPHDDAPIEGFQGVVDTYHDLFVKHRGAKPIYTEADFSAFRRLCLTAGGAEEATVLVQKMFAKAGYCRAEMTIQTLARDPQKVLGDAAPARGGPSTLQGPSGYAARRDRQKATAGT